MVAVTGVFPLMSARKVGRESIPVAASPISGLLFVQSQVLAWAPSKFSWGIVVPFNTVIFRSVSATGAGSMLPLTAMVRVDTPALLNVIVPLIRPVSGNACKRTYKVSRSPPRVCCKVNLGLKLAYSEVEITNPGDADAEILAVKPWPATVKN